MKSTSKKEKINNFYSKANENKILEIGTYLFYEYTDMDGRYETLYYTFNLNNKTTIKKVIESMNILGFRNTSSVYWIAKADAKKVEELREKIENLLAEYKELTGREF